jgi:hypothetical protein
VAKYRPPGYVRHKAVSEAQKRRYAEMTPEERKASTEKMRAAIVRKPRGRGRATIEAERLTRAMQSAIVVLSSARDDEMMRIITAKDILLSALASAHIQGKPEASRPENLILIVLVGEGRGSVYVDAVEWVRACLHGRPCLSRDRIGKPINSPALPTWISVDDVGRIENLI